MIGTLTEVVRAGAGTALTSDRTDTDSQLFVNDTADFAPTGGRLVTGGVKKAYTSITDTTIQLSGTIGVSLLEGEEVQPLDVRETGLEEWTAWVLLDDDERATPARVPTALVAFFPEGKGLAGASVELALDDRGWRVTSQPNQVPVIDSDFITTPIASAAYRITKTIPSGTWWNITDVVVTDQVDFTVDVGGRWWPQVEGYYLIIWGATFANSSDGNARQVRIVIYDEAGTADPLRAPSTLARTAGTTSIETSTAERLRPGMSVGFEAFQASTANLGLVGQDGDPARRPTDFTILKVAP